MQDPVEQTPTIEKSKKKSWSSRRKHVEKILGSHHLHALIALVVFVDVTCVACELMIRDVCITPVFPQEGDLGGMHRMESWAFALSWTSRALVFFLFAREIMLLFMKGIDYFRSIGHVADMIILTVAMGLEIGMLVEEQKKKNQSTHSSLEKDTGAEEAGNIIVVLLAWRVVRVLHGLYLTAEDAERTLDETQVEELRAYIKQLEDRVKELSPSSSHSFSGARMHT